MQLFLVATPIGNLQDFSFRAIDTLKKADLIYCEDTRVSQKLLSFYEIETPLKTYHEHNAQKVRPDILRRLQEGQKIALISDAGLPLISDPGYKLVVEAHELNIPVTVIPGPTAPLSALAASGLPTDQFMFLGFLPSKSTARQKAFEENKSFDKTLIFFESAQRLVDSLQDAHAMLGNRLGVVARELTKTYEEVKRASLLDLITYYKENPPRGEIVLLISGKQEDETPGFSEAWEKLIQTAAQCYKSKEAASLIAEVSPFSKKEIYDYVLKQKHNA